jgi:hypothetical protein
MRRSAGVRGGKPHLCASFELWQNLADQVEADMRHLPSPLSGDSLIFGNALARKVDRSARHLASVSRALRDLSTA